jgi:ribonucleotide reductase, class II
MEFNNRDVRSLAKFLEIEPHDLSKFPVGSAVFYRSYSRPNENGYESWSQCIKRSLEGLRKLGKFTDEEFDLVYRNAMECKTLPSGRWMWCGGSEWIENQENFYGGYNCTSNEVDEPSVFGWLMGLSMQGCGTGAVLERRCIDKLPPISRKLNLSVVGEFGEGGKSTTHIEYDAIKDIYKLNVGDSRQGWVDSYQFLIDLAMGDKMFGTAIYRQINIVIDVSNVRESGKKLKGFGGTANPLKLKEFYPKIANLLNDAYGRKLTAEECCLLIDEAAIVVVAGSIRRSAGMRQFDREQPLLKSNLWQQDENGNWSIDPKRDALRMANHTRVFHTKPDYETIKEAVTIQFQSGEGAIQYVNEAIVRANVDIFNTPGKKLTFLNELDNGNGRGALESIGADNIEHRLHRYGLNPCGEIIGQNFHCNLSEVHLNQINPFDFYSQIDAFEAASLDVTALLNHVFENERWKKSREIDPIVGVSITGLFDFFVNAFGRDWLLWWQEGRPEYFKGQSNNYADKFVIQHFDVYGELMDLAYKSNRNDMNKADFFRVIEREYLKLWKSVVDAKVGEYCTTHNLKVPNRCTTVQPAGSKSLLSNASPGWHPPKATRYLRRVTYRKNDPVALTLRDFGYNILPSQSDKDENGRLLDDPFDPRCTEWLVEIPVEVSWANMGEGIDINQFSAIAQFDFYMQVQKHYTAHNSSSTIELRVNEIEPLAKAIYNAIQRNDGYISAALLARFDDNSTFPRLPFEPISQDVYNELSRGVIERRTATDFVKTLNEYAIGHVAEVAPSGCDSDACMMPERKP